MKRQLAVLCLCALAFGLFQLPARAGIDVSFGRHDYNHDHRWNYREFNDANTYYYRHHPHAQVIYGSRRDFDRLDTNRDGYLDLQEAGAYRNWD